MKTLSRSNKGCNVAFNCFVFVEASWKAWEHLGYAEVRYVYLYISLLESTSMQGRYATLKFIYFLHDFLCPQLAFLDLRQYFKRTDFEKCVNSWSSRINGWGLSV